jgi:trimethylamine--corrinoid protein Co-methyltransferase
MKVDEKSHRVHIRRALIEKCLATTPSVIKMFDRSRDKEYVVGGDELHFDPGS